MKLVAYSGVISLRCLLQHPSPVWLPVNELIFWRLHRGGAIVCKIVGSQFTKKYCVGFVNLSPLK